MEDLLKQYKAQIEALQLELVKKQNRIEKAEKILSDIFNEIEHIKAQNFNINLKLK